MLVSIRGKRVSVRGVCVCVWCFMVSVPLSPFISEGQMDVAFVMGEG